MASRNLICIEPEWIPHSENQQPNYLSCIQDKDDWLIRPEVFSYIDTLWGPHEVNRFANNFNAQLGQFNSRFWYPGTEAVDIFTCDWVQEIKQICPPPYLIPRAIRHTKETSAKGTLVVPSWPSAPFWPILFPERALFVKDVMVLSKQHQALLPGRQGDILPVCDLLAIHFNFGTGGQSDMAASV